jgi:Uncharacterized protein conserved in bacteria (DUF2188)
MREVSFFENVLRRAAMSPTRYFLVQHDDEWMIKFGDEEFGPYKSKAEAMLFAVEAAQKLAERGAETEVCLMGENGFFHAEWSNAQPAHAALA